jgi:hypothetical protein
MGDYELNRELRGLKNDKIMTERAVDSEKNRWAELLKGELGQDMKDVLSGKKKVKLSFKEKMNYRFEYYKNKIKKFFNKDEEYIV